MTLFSAWSGPRRPKMLLVGEAWGEHEETARAPFVGESGKELWRMLGEAMPDLWPSEHARVADLHRFGLAWIKSRTDWLSEASIAFTNVFNFRPLNNKIPSICCAKKDLPHDYDCGEFPALVRGLYLQPQYLPELFRLRDEIRESAPNLVVAMGNTATWATLQATNISSIRGNTTSSSIMGRPIKVLPTYHPASLLYEGQWQRRPIIVTDLMKACRESQFPDIRRPRRSILINPTLAEIRDWRDSVFQNPPPYLACDTETTAGLIDTIGFAKSADDAIVSMIGPHRVKIGQRFDYIFPKRDGQKTSSYFTVEEELQFWPLIFSLLESNIPKVFQNGLYDLQYLLKLGCCPNNCTEDTMLLHHSLYPEQQKSLGFLGSIHTDESSWKLMRKHHADTEKRDE